MKNKCNESSSEFQGYLDGMRTNKKKKIKKE